MKIKRQKSTLLIFWVLAATSAFCAPGPGDVFFESGIQIDRTLQGDGAAIGPIPVPGNLSLDAATKAEIDVEYANVHLGVRGLAVRANGGEWVPVPFPESVPALECAQVPGGDRSHIYQMPIVTVAVPLANFRPGTGNAIEFMTPDKGENHKAFTQIYGATVRVFYDPAKRPRPRGKIISPRAGDSLGGEVALGIEVEGGVSRVEYMGLFEDLDYTGDGIYREWISTRRFGELGRNLATSEIPPFSATWDTSWIPDQKEPAEIAARVVGEDGLIYFTEAVGGLGLDRREFSVELCKPEGILNGFSTCTYGKPATIYTAEKRNKTEYFHFSGDPKSVADARLYFACWRRGGQPEMELNGIPLEGIAVDGKGSQFVEVPLRPLAALAAGNNTLVLVNAKDGGTDIEWPGVQVLVRSKKTE